MNLTRPVRNFQRWRDVQGVLLRYGFDILFDWEEIQEIRSVLRRRFRVSLGSFDSVSTPARVRMMLQELGPTYVKLGQVVSSRSDMLTPEWNQELSKLQDAVPPFSFGQVQQILRDELGKPPEEVFLILEKEPVAAASIGQVHRAVLLDLRPVVVKVQRPNIRVKVEADIEIMTELARLIENRTAWGRRYGVTAIVEEFARTLRLEMDYQNEAANARRLRHNMQGLQGVRVPYIYDTHSTARVLTMENVDGVKINDLEALDAAGIDRRQLAEVFLRSIFQQLLIDGFFHADPHPANLLVDTRSGDLHYIDLGMMGSMLPDQRRQLCDIVLAILRRDARVITSLVISIGTEFQPVDRTRLERDVDHIINRYLEMPLEQIRFSEMLGEILKIVFENGIRLPSEFSLAIKAVIQGEAVARTLDPEIVIVDIARGISRQILRQRADLNNLVSQVSGPFTDLVSLGRALPGALHQLLRHAEAGKMTVGIDFPDLSQELGHVTVIINRMTVGLVFIGMFIGSSIAMNVSPTTSWPIIPVLGVIGFILSLVMGGMLVWSVVWDMWRSRRKKN